MDSLDNYKTLIEAHGNVCGICGEAEMDNPSLSIDHCHTTGKIRGLLCTRCNRGLGLFKDNSKNLLNAVKYLERYALNKS